MKTLLALTLVCTFTASVYALPDYEPFADATSGGGTSYTPGANLGGQITSQGLTWADVGTTQSGAFITVSSGNLTVPGMPAPQGNSITFGGLGKSARLGLGSTISSGTVYFSFAIDITSITGLSTSGIFWAGLNNSTGIQAAQPTAVGDKIFTRAISGGFEFGFSKNSTAATDVSWDTTVRTVNQTHFLVGSYTFGSASQLWIDPSSSTFGDNSMQPAATLTGNAGGDITAVASWLFAQRNALEPAAMIADELYFGSSWADVTSAVPEPSTYVLGGLGLLAMVGRWRSGRR